MGSMIAKVWLLLLAVLFFVTVWPSRTLSHPTLARLLVLSQLVAAAYLATSH